jgi:hypothetical protein
MDKNSEILFSDYEGKKFKLLNRNWMIKEGKLCIETVKDGFLPIDGGEVLFNEVWRYLLNENNTK